MTGAIEALFIIEHGKYWYPFVSLDFCCHGAKSTYKIMVGRSRNVTGPSVDKKGKLMTEGGGTLLLDATQGGQWVGLGYCAVLQDVSGDYLSFHAYDILNEFTKKGHGCNKTVIRIYHNAPVKKIWYQFV